MKLNIILSAVVLGLGLCSQSFGFELLDRMLGVSGGGCCESGCTKKSCCEAAKDPGCCAAAEPTCGAVDPTCGAEPACGCEAKSDCGCSKPKCCRQPLFNFHRCCKPKCASACDSCAKAAEPTCAAVEATCAAEPTCGAEPACGCEAKSSCGCKSKCCGSLLDRIFVCNKRCYKPKTCCNAAPSCGCEAGGKAAPVMEGGDAPPMPPAPVVDPSAFVPSQRRVVHASNGSLR